MESIEEEVPLAERKNMLYEGTPLTRGAKEEILMRRHWLAIAGYTLVIAAVLGGAFVLALTENYTNIKRIFVT